MSTYDPIKEGIKARENIEITEEHEDINDRNLKVKMREFLYKAAEEIRKQKLLGYRHSGSFAVHYYFNDLDSKIVAIPQLNLNDTSPTALAFGVRLLDAKLRQAYGQPELNKNKYKGGDAKDGAERRREAKAKVEEMKKGSN